ncbi:hypothetical protein [Archangium sp.]|uniref:hypothetical protein n=1 Tax=Archangium sp. TaxID=1872627 RepID=UPI002D41A65A|nr:hypothetical protein [Archangium sp.]HYO57451.1 hypothetical protein [Archangium sp.]
MLRLDDPLIDELRAHEQQARRQAGLPMITSWVVHRRYTAKELLAAELFCLSVRPRFYPTGEDCGTVYDEARGCTYCGVGANQVGPLRLDLEKIPRRDIAQTFGGEIVVSSRLAAQMEAAGIQGHKLGPVLGRHGKQSQDWFQLLLPTGNLELSARTQVGRSFFAPEPDPARCPEHVLGSRVLSQIHVERESVGEADWHCSRLALGERFGTGRPEPLLFISPRLYRLFVEKKVKRFFVEVARLSERQ